MSIKCTNCGMELGPSIEQCSNCGGNSRSIGVQDSIVPRVHVSIGVKGGAPDAEGALTKSAVRYEVRAGSMPSQVTSSGRAEVLQRIDRDGQEHGVEPWYDKKVVDPDTGEVLTDRSHSLPEKPPSGSAKPKK